MGFRKLFKKPRASRVTPTSDYALKIDIFEPILSDVPVLDISNTGIRISLPCEQEFPGKKARLAIKFPGEKKQIDLFGYIRRQSNPSETGPVEYGIEFFDLKTGNSKIKLENIRAIINAQTKAKNLILGR